MSGCIVTEGGARGYYTATRESLSTEGAVTNRLRKLIFLVITSWLLLVTAIEPMKLSKLGAHSVSYMEPWHGSVSLRVRVATERTKIQVVDHNSLAPANSRLRQTT